MAGCREVHAAERSNLIIAIADLTFRYPNLLEPWTAHIYKPLSDPDQGAGLASTILPKTAATIPPPDASLI